MNQRDTLMIVDDMEINRVILRGMFEHEFNLLEAENGQQALLLLSQYHEKVAAMLLDLIMPVMDGYALMDAIRKDENLSKIPVIVITADDTMESGIRVFDLGASDIVTKPLEPHVVKRRIQNIVDLNRHKWHLEELVEEQAVKLRESNEVIIDALSSVIEYRSLESGQHIRRIRMFTKLLLENVADNCPEYGLNHHQIQIIADASSLHDIGKIAIPDSILNKPGPLTAEEFRIMKTHTVKGCEILKELVRMDNKEYLRYAYNICRYHHERWDGGGYPDALKGDGIPICAQVVAIADCYDALTTNRVYKSAYTHECAFNMILNGECGVFSPALLECFKNVCSSFEELAQEYADGMEPKAEDVRIEPAVDENQMHGLRGSDLGQLKYLALLRYMEATVMEADPSAGTYHLIYLGDRSFESLRSGSTFEESLRNFAGRAVHPEDRWKVDALLEHLLNRFFDEGQMKLSTQYRVFDRDKGDYTLFRATLLRTEVENPKRRKVILIWQKPEKEQISLTEEKLPDIGEGKMFLRLLDGVLCCRNDRWLTIIHTSEVFRSLVGYSKEEIAEQFHGQFLELIHPNDRDRFIRQIRMSMNYSNVGTAECRVMTNDGRMFCFLVKSEVFTRENGEEALHLILTDITSLRAAEEELRLSLKRHEIILQQTHDIIFEWDIENDILNLSDKWVEEFGYQAVREKISEQMRVFSHMHPDDISTFSNSVKAIKSGKAYLEGELRIADSDGHYRWCKLRSTTLFGDDGRPFKAIGVIENIDEEKKENNRLRDKADRDGLTSLYNKKAGHRKIDAFMENREPDSLAAMLIIDLDNFKEINDTYGHMFGDAVLSGFSEELSNIFRDGSVVCRIGGDEFLVFMNRISCEGVAEERAHRTIESFQQLFREQIQDSQLSCSIGIAFAPQDGTTYQMLFQHSDMALYRAKASGKNRYVIYSRSHTVPKIDKEGRDKNILTRIDSEAVLEPMHLTAKKIFEELYESEEIDRSVNQVLEILGRQFDVSRVYLYENSGDHKFCRNTFEWCSDGTASRQKTCQDIPCETGYYSTNFNENDIFYCQDVKKYFAGGEMPGSFGDDTMSALQCKIRTDGMDRGFIGFDDCDTCRMWTEAEIEMISYAAKLLKVFLIDAAAKDSLMNGEK